MKIEKLEICNFRNIENISLFPDDKMNVICGENAQGKTNIIEAIWLFTGAKSFRANKETEFVKFGQSKGVNKVIFESRGVKNNAKIEFADKNTAFLNDKRVNNTSRLAGVFNAVVFSPSDLSLVKDGPSVRRRFLDIAIGQLYPNYIEILRSYNRAVVQRNKIIKDFKYDTSLSVMLDVFEEEIASSGEKIINYRKKYLDLLGNFLPEIYNGLSGRREEIESLYVANCDGTMLKESLLKSRGEDTYTGNTSKGPHRDDIDFKINGISARGFGSQGQQRSVALSLKFAQAEVIKQISGEYPIALLDDVMSELDETRQNYVLNHINAWQVFISCCDPSNVERLESGKIIRVEKGGIL